MAYDSARQIVVVFGGARGGGYDISGITCDARGNLFFEVDVIAK